MAHETGSATSIVDLQDKLRLFCIAQGIQVNDWRDYGNAPGKVLSVQFNGGFFSITTIQHASDTVEGFALSQSSSWSAATDVGSQPDETPYAGVRTDCDITLAIPTYHFAYFVGGVVMVSFLSAVGSWRHMAFGHIEKYGVWTGGAAVFGHWIADNGGNGAGNPNDGDHNYFGETHVQSQNSYGGAIRCDATGPNQFRRLNSGGLVATRVKSNVVAGRQHMSPNLMTSPSMSTQASSLTPFLFAVPVLDADSIKCAPIGTLRDVRMVNMKNVDNEQIFDNDWMVICQGVKRDPAYVDQLENTGMIGLAIRIQ